MRRPELLRIGARILLLVGLVWTLSLAGRRAPEALARIPVFDARAYEFPGLRYLTEESALRTAGIGPDASLWDDPEVWETRLERHPLVLDARVRRRFPGTLVVEVTERQPVGLVPTPTLAPVDRDGRYLPLDPARFALDFPVLRPTQERGGQDRPPAPARVRELARTADALRADAEFWSEISEIAPGPHGGFVVRRGSPLVEFRLPPRVDPTLIRYGLVALDDARRRGDGRVPEVVDLRFAGKVYLDWGRRGQP